MSKYIINTIARKKQESKHGVFLNNVKINILVLRKEARVCLEKSRHLKSCLFLLYIEKDKMKKINSTFTVKGKCAIRLTQSELLGN